MTQLPKQESKLTSENFSSPHEGRQVLGEQGLDGRKGFFIQLEARPGYEDAVVQMLRDIRACVEDEPATGPWFAVRFTQSKFAIFEAFPDLAGRQAHVEGGGGDVFRDVARLNAILANAAKIHRVDVLMSKDTFSHFQPAEKDGSAGANRPTEAIQTEIDLRIDDLSQTARLQQVNGGERTC